MMKRYLAALFSLLMLAALLTACGGSGDTPAGNGTEPAAPVDSGDSGEEETKASIRMGTSSVSIDLAESGVKALEDMGYEVEVVVFDDYFLPNTALAEGSLDANLYQHEPFLDQYNENNNTDIIMLRPILYEFYGGLYSAHTDTVEGIPEGGIVGIATDASNIDRDLRNLRDTGLITLTDAPQSGDMYTILDIVDNPKNLQFIESDHTKYLNQEDYACFLGTSNTMATFDVDPTENLLVRFSESENALGICVMPEYKDAQWVQDLMAAYTSDEAVANVPPESGFEPAFR